MAQKVIQKDPNSGNVIRVWASAYQASEALNCSTQQIKRCCAGVRTTPVGGYMWDYADDNAPVDVTDNTTAFITPNEVSKFGQYLTNTDKIVTVVQGPDAKFFVMNPETLQCNHMSSLGDVLLRKV
ncbi:MAG: hypothetical protein RL621_1851 [Bacteroidota bacterium]|jgi:hypothetical protein